MNSNSWSAMVIGAGVSAVIFVIVSNYLNGSNTGGGRPRQARYTSYTARTPGGQVTVRTPPFLSPNAAPVAQNQPITEAAYNVQPTAYAPTLGPEENSPNTPVTLPM
jgi:hypothetical protein